MLPSKYEVAKIAMKRWIIDIDNGLIFTREGLAKRVEARGYKTVDTTYEGKKYSFKQHQIIAIAAGLDPRGKEVNHIDGVKTNNCISNLEVVTPSENTKHAHRIGLARAVNRRFTEEQVVNLRRRHKNGERVVDLADEIGCQREVLGRMLRGVTYKNIN